MKLGLRSGIILAISATISIACAAICIACTSPQAAENGALNDEQLGCVAATLVDEDTTAQVQEIASDIVQACPSVQAFTKDLINIINSFIANGSTMKVDASTLKHRKVRK
jgi:hypothetical protein